MAYNTPYIFSGNGNACLGILNCNECNCTEIITSDIVINTIVTSDIITNQLSVLNSSNIPFLYTNSIGLNSSSTFSLPYGVTITNPVGESTINAVASVMSGSIQTPDVLCDYLNNNLSNNISIITTSDVYINPGGKAYYDSNEILSTNNVKTLTNKTISGSSNTLSNIGNSALVNSGMTLNGIVCVLGSSDVLTSTTANTLTLGTGLLGTSFNGSSPVTVTIDTSVCTLTGSQTLTNKTLTTPTIGSITNGSYQLTIPTLAASDTICGLVATQTLSNKTFVAPTLGAAAATSINFGITSLNYYNEYENTGGSTSGAWTQTLTYSLVRVGKTVTYSMQTVLSSNPPSAALLALPSIPAAFTPVYAPIYILSGQNNGVKTYLFLQINTNSTVYIGTNSDLSNGFTASNLGAVYQFSVSWNLLS